MPDGPPPEKPRAKGNALPRSELDIDIRSRVTDRDIADARRDWRRRMPDDVAGMIDARPEKGGKSDG